MKSSLEILNESSWETAVGQHKFRPKMTFGIACAERRKAAMRIAGRKSLPCFAVWPTVGKRMPLHKPEPATRLSAKRFLRPQERWARMAPLSLASNDNLQI